MNKYCFELIDDNFTLYAVLDKGLETFKWSLFRDGRLIDCGDLSEAAQMNPKVFIAPFAQALFATYKGIDVYTFELNTI